MRQRGSWLRDVVQIGTFAAIVAALVIVAALYEADPTIGIPFAALVVLGMLEVAAREGVI